ncbi:hypothetical protein RE6C_01392 [Rhodopirellula europaea 6C]|uniref:Uncharacterized protein n=1 Tax=Rhodopirellula europaea 6C TaxID=1263867 RepID=M2AYV6_9BACT|nr:hypothetical protein RE6C_01392 [Rhodopirellula europaea 6C]
MVLFGDTENCLFQRINTFGDKFSTGVMFDRVEQFNAAALKNDALVGILGHCLGRDGAAVFQSGVTVAVGSSKYSRKFSRITARITGYERTIDHQIRCV